MATRAAAAVAAAWALLLLHVAAAAGAGPAADGGGACADGETCVNNHAALDGTAWTWPATSDMAGAIQQQLLDSWCTDIHGDAVASAERAGAALADCRHDKDELRREALRRA
eukprot:SM007820S22535  [mRNA]  locus=s7820:11:618:- [translate_table: standard]